MINLTIPGPPAGKQRARILKTGLSYTPKKTVNYETLIKELFAVNYPDHMPWKNGVSMTIKAYFQIAKSCSKKMRAYLEGDHAWYPHRIDGDNLWKIVADALNGLAYVDDGQIVDGCVMKFYSSRPRIEIELEETK